MFPIWQLSCVWITDARQHCWEFGILRWQTWNLSCKFCKLTNNADVCHGL